MSRRLRIKIHTRNSFACPHTHTCSSLVLRHQLLVLNLTCCLRVTHDVPQVAHNKHILVIVSHARMILLPMCFKWGLLGRGTLFTLPFKTHAATAEVLQLELVGGPQVSIS